MEHIQWAMQVASGKGACGALAGAFARETACRAVALPAAFNEPAEGGDQRQTLQSPPREHDEVLRSERRAEFVVTDSPDRELASCDPLVLVKKLVGGNGV